MELSNIKAQGHQRMRYAYQCAEEAKLVFDNNSGKPYLLEKRGNNKFKYDQYTSRVEKLPMMILNNGVGAALAFIFSKKSAKGDKNSYDLLYLQLEEWLTTKNLLRASPTTNAQPDLIYTIANGDMEQHKAIAKELLELLKWLKRFANGLIPNDEKKGASNGEPTN